MGQEVADVDLRIRQTELTWHELHVVAAAGAATTPGTTAFADDVVDDVLAATAFPRCSPLQPQRCLIHYGDDILWC